MQAWMNIFQEPGFVWSNGQTRPRRIFRPQIFTLTCAWSLRQEQPQSRPLRHTLFYPLPTVKLFAAPPAPVATYV